MQVVLAGDAPSELVEVQLGEDDCACRAQRGHRGGVLGGNPVGEQTRIGRCSQAGRRDAVLDPDRNAMEWASAIAVSAARVIVHLSVGSSDRTRSIMVST